MSGQLELIACQPHPIESKGFNLNATLPYGCTIEHIVLAMNNFIEFLGFINQQLYSKEMERLEVMLMPANFSSMVGEFMISNIPKYCSSLVKNQYHNGHPDLIPAGMFPKNSVQHSHIGIEVKASRYQSGWQGHNPEDTWLMIFVFDSNRPSDAVQGIQPKPFRFIKVVGASLTKNDWSFSGRSEISRRTITASVTKSGYQKMMSNWIYKIPNLP
ncbi:hypothetical protein [Nostoc sp. UHCC 0251]|uniref:hypothetical protein n=1 Tax=Nostoc sp. UHCC 0251 TaxID=3110240 RepID=UPI002B1F3015|nr:hypothetical protein [Nostoc sp. UHCC 0251]MEA5623863.1 hypothetical protein [Nostoc sp. UHCC 0251]